MNQLVGKLFHSLLQTHIFHLQTTSYSEHMALGEYYETLQGLIDSLVEVYQGKYEIITNYKISPIKNLYNYNVERYLEELYNFIVTERTNMGITENSINNILDDIEVLLSQTLYKIKNLK